MCAPIVSYNVATRNVLLKVTVPKRTGRKRKRGSDDQYSGDSVGPNPTNTSPEISRSSTSVRSQGRQDNPKELVSMLRDNIGHYEIQAVANIQHTHRFRGTRAHTNR
jgi:general transcription factor 3C polypeptide 5 (transcription factor C subunit 1)